MQVHHCNEKIRNSKNIVYMYATILSAQKVYGNHCIHVHNDLAWWDMMCLRCSFLPSLLPHLHYCVNTLFNHKAKHEGSVPCRVTVIQPSSSAWGSSVTCGHIKCESQSLREWKNEAIKMKLCVLMEKWILFHSSKMQTDNHKNCINMIWKFKMTEPGDSKIKKSPILFLIVWKNPGMGTEWTGVPHCKSLCMHMQWFVYHNFYYNLTKNWFSYKLG